MAPAVQACSRVRQPLDIVATIEDQSRESNTCKSDSTAVPFLTSSADSESLSLLSDAGIAYSIATRQAD